MHRVLLVAAVAILVGIAGCPALDSGGNDGTTPTQTQTSTPTPPSSPTPTPSGSTLNATDLGAAHAGALDAADSFTKHFRMNTSFSSLVQERVRVDGRHVWAERSASPDEPNNTFYRDLGGLSLRLVADNGTVSYEHRADANATSFVPTEQAIPGQVADFVTATDWERIGREQYRGTAVIRYEVEPGGNVSGFQREPRSRAVNGRANAELLVGTDGVVRRMHVRYRGSGEFFVTTYRFTEVGSTTVTEPDWVDAARSDGEN